MGLFSAEPPKYDTTPTPPPADAAAPQAPALTVMRKQAKNPALAVARDKVTVTTADGTAISVTVPRLPSGKAGKFRLDVSASPVHLVPGVGSLVGDRLVQLQGLTVAPDDALTNRLDSDEDVTITPQWIAPGTTALDAGKLQSVLTIRFLPVTEDA